MKGRSKLSKTNGLYDRLSVGTDDASIILISRKAMISLSDGELKFMIKPAEFIHPEDAAALRQLESIPGFPVVAKKIVVLGFEQLRS